MSLQILFRDNSNLPNRELVEFLENNLKTIVKSRYVIDPIIVSEDKIEMLIESGIEELPAMRFNDIVKIGVTNIVDYIKFLCEKTAKKTDTEAYDEIVRDFMQKDGPDDKDDDDDTREKFENEIKRKTEEMNARRANRNPSNNKSKAGAKTPGGNNASGSGNASSGGGNKTVKLDSDSDSDEKPKHIVNKPQNQPINKREVSIEDKLNFDDDDDDEKMNIMPRGNSRDDQMERAMLSKLDF
jgi:hypothetical protein